MHLKKIVAGATISGALGFTALGLGVGTANADDHGPWVPWQPGDVVRDWVPWVPRVGWQPWQGDGGWQGEGD
jgi:hypothetical protein